MINVHIDTVLWNLYISPKSIFIMYLIISFILIDVA